MTIKSKFHDCAITASPSRRRERSGRLCVSFYRGGSGMTIMVEQGVDSSVAGLVRRAAEGDRHAWEGLVDQYARLIWSITVDFKLTESDAADVAQTTWLRLLQHIDRIEHPDRVGSWLAATARNECLRSLAARKRVVPVHDDVELDQRGGARAGDRRASSRRRAGPGCPRRALPPAPALAAATGDAHGRSASPLRRHIR